jgi:hypothetical protein
MIGVHSESRAQWPSTKIGEHLASSSLHMHPPVDAWVMSGLKVVNPIRDINPNDNTINFSIIDKNKALSNMQTGRSN